MRASLFRRAIALLIDLIILAAVSYVLLYPLNEFLEEHYLIHYLLKIFTLCGYFSLFEAFKNGQTLGKKIMDIQVVSTKPTASGLTLSQISFKHSLLRSILFFITYDGPLELFNRDSLASIYFFYFLCFVGLFLIIGKTIFILTNKEHQGFYEVLSHTASRKWEGNLIKTDSNPFYPIHKKSIPALVLASAICTVGVSIATYHVFAHDIPLNQNKSSLLDKHVRSIYFEGLNESENMNLKEAFDILLSKKHAHKQIAVVANTSNDLILDQNLRNAFITKLSEHYKNNIDLFKETKKLHVSFISCKVIGIFCAEVKTSFTITTD